MERNSKLFIDLPSDILLWIFSECSVLDVLSLSSSCKRLQQATDEYQVWLDQARSLQDPIPPGTTSSKAELRDLVISRTRVEVCWTKPRPGDLSLHLFETDTEFVDAHLIPGGEFAVLLYMTGDIGLNKIERSAVTGELKLREVFRYKANRDDYPGLWSRLLTETSYGCPVLVCADAIRLDGVFVFLIDPVTQVVEKKHHVRCDFGVDGDGIWKILAIRDRIFFCENIVGETIRITVVEKPGPNAVTKYFGLEFPTDYSASDVRFFAISENCFVVTSVFGIWLYHIPEFRSVGEDTMLVPVWNLLVDASDYRGTLYKTASPYPALWLQGEQNSCTLEFDVEKSGCYPVVANYKFVVSPPDFYMGTIFKLQGRKGMSIEAGPQGEITFNTEVLGKPDTRRLRAQIPGLNDEPRITRDEVKYVDLDEETGRIMVVVGPVQGNIPYARQLYIADLPP